MRTAKWEEESCKSKRNVPFGHGGDIICMVLDEACELLNELFVLMQTGDGSMGGEPDEAVLVSVESLGNVRVCANDERESLKRTNTGS